MREEIRNTIYEIEKSEGIHAISCRSFGSHMMNLDSPESDYDAFLIFAQDASDYATIGGYEDTLTIKRGEIDFQCWNIKKFGELLNDSNPTTLEFLNSPVTYFENPEFIGTLDELREMANANFKPIALYYHYRSMAESNYMKYLKPCIYDTEGERYPIENEDDHYWHTGIGDIPKESDEYEAGNLKQTVKRNLYIMRAILHAKHIRTTHEMPTMDFPKFASENAESLGLGEDEYELLQSFIEKKRNAEAYDHAGNPFEDFIEAELDRELTPENHLDGEMNTEMINDFIKNAIVR
ncbi:nucleotidyltransferase [Halogranum tailed virus 1]|uniref:Nucleotidyltransferase n=1 Tax=Halogranum tailed virus 1 TaxID=1273749 RepID=R4T6V9_9CAUD|nr:nucleotidyltransferase [Halogranum tailed virus 1]AGM11424.1 nucleotidyltransferase [Halogranum tailed virus 1]